MKDMNSKNVRNMTNYEALLEDVPTCELVKALRGREGVETKEAAPYEDLSVTVNGAAMVLVVTD